MIIRPAQLLDIENYPLFMLNLAILSRKLNWLDD